ncbi:MarR family winged helix-turn-helix transcriptional regulator [Falsihalocynthiibacter sp. S25ZX9]|uniref:MarR family winged helix-turn-helix transcriptional regulator n=1 Tax=Falsihalocynthiibacter sp. S25ZX9 TaxID=3240870 RepID=UPI00350F2ACC
MDHVDKIVAQWTQERPELDVGPMEVIGRIVRLANVLNQEMERVFERHDLTAASFDVLATLRRSGAPFSLSPGALIGSTMVTSGTMTNRIDRLVTAGLVERRGNPKDKRGFLICLTAAGHALIDRVVEDHVARQAELVGALSEEEREVLVKITRNLTDAIGALPE